MVRGINPTRNYSISIRSNTITTVWRRMNKCYISTSFDLLTYVCFEKVSV